MSQDVHSDSAGRSQTTRQSARRTASDSGDEIAKYCHVCSKDLTKRKLVCLSCKHAFHFKCVNYAKYESAQILEYYCDDCYREYKCITVWRMIAGTRRQRSNKATGFYEVQAILDHRMIDKKIEYLIQWKDCPPDQATWQSESSCKEAPELVNRYRRNLKLPPLLPCKLIKRKWSVDTLAEDYESVEGRDPICKLANDVKVDDSCKSAEKIGFVEQVEILEMVDKLRRAAHHKLKSKAEVAILGVDTTELEDRTIYIFDHDGHRYAIQRRQQKIYICDGTNEYLRSIGKDNVCFKKQFEEYQIAPIRYDHHHRDSCGIAIIMIILAMLRMDHSGIYHSRISKFSKYTYEILKKRFYERKKMSQVEAQSVVT